MTFAEVAENWTILPFSDRLESGNPDKLKLDWISAFAGMTGRSGVYTKMT